MSVLTKWGWGVGAGVTDYDLRATEDADVLQAQGRPQLI